MWTKCQIKVLGEVKSGVSMSGNEWVRQNCVLAWVELDGNGQPLKDQTGKDVVSNAQFDLGKNRIDELSTIGAQVGSQVWADIRCRTESKYSQRGNAYLSNNVYVAQFARIQ